MSSLGRFPRKIATVLLYMRVGRVRRHFVAFLEDVPAPVELPRGPRPPTTKSWSVPFTTSEASEASATLQLRTHHALERRAGHSQLLHQWQLRVAPTTATLLGPLFTARREFDPPRPLPAGAHLSPASVWSNRALLHASSEGCRLFFSTAPLHEQASLTRTSRRR